MLKKVSQKSVNCSDPVETGSKFKLWTWINRLKVARKSNNREYYNLCYKTNGAHWNLQRINNNNQLDLQLLDNISKLKFCKIITNRQVKMAYKNSIYAKGFNQSQSMMSYFMSHTVWLMLARGIDLQIGKGFKRA